jgi:hypothetical protein
MTATGHRANGSRSRRMPPVPWAGKHKVLAALVSALVIAAVAVTVAMVSSSSRASVPHSPGGAHSAPPAGPVSYSVTKGSKWLTGPAAKLLDNVNADLSKVTTDDQAGKHGAAEAAAARLVKAARAALRGPMPPVDANVYQAALNDLKTGGADVASGNFSTATRLLNAGEIGITKVTSAADLPVPVKTATVPEPNG